MRYVIAGDSMSDPRAGQGMIGFGALYWPYQLALLRSQPSMLNLAIGGNGVADQADHILAFQPSPEDICFLFLGNVDQTWRGASSGALQVYSSVLSAEIACWATEKRWASEADWTFSGAWVNFTPYGGGGKFTQLQGAYAEISFNGPIVEFAYLLQDGNSSIFSVEIDGNSMGSFSSAPPAGILTGNPNSTRNYAPGLLRFTGLSGGPHTMRVTKLDASSPALTILWAGFGYNGRDVYVLTLPNGPNAAVQDRVDQYNLTIAAAVAAARSAGRTNVKLVEAGKYIEPAYDLVAGDIHMVNNGMAKYAAAISAVMG